MRYVVACQPIYSLLGQSELRLDGLGQQGETQEFHQILSQLLEFDGDQQREKRKRSILIALVEWVGYVLALV